MPQFTIPGSLITANVLRVSQDVTPGENFRRATVTLVDTNGQWGASPDPTRHIVRWGFQSSEDGTNWQWGPVMQEEPAPGLPFGSRDRSGGMPALSIEGSNIVGLGTTQLRLAILTDANIRLGASIVTG